jgi:hypothetical protein
MVKEKRMPKVEIYDKLTQSRYTVDDASKFRDSSRYEIQTAEDATEARRTELNKMRRADIDTLAEPFGINLTDFNKTELIDEVILFETGAKKVEGVSGNNP